MKKRKGRPNTYSFEMAKDICDLVKDGMNIKEALKSKEDYPTFQTWCNWKRDNSELFDLYINAIQDKSESVICEIDEISKDLRNGILEPSTANVLIQTLKWKAAKFYPKMFGEKSQVDHTSGGEKINITPISFVGTKDK